LERQNIIDDNDKNNYLIKKYICVKGKIMKKISAKKLALWIIILAAVAFITYDFVSPMIQEKNMQKISYKEFYSKVESGNVKSADITESKIVFTTTESESKQVTENPSSPELKEFLMRNGVEVNEEKDFTELLSTIFDWAFTLVFIFIIVFAFRKFISPNTFKVQHKTGVTFKDVVGMEGLKHDMTQVMKIMQNPAEYEAKGIRMPKGILLEGEPGNGKTLFAKALAGEAKVNFIPAKATDFESMFMAIGPMKVKLLFSKARKRAPCIVFIDEFDGIGTKRNYSGSGIETENTRIVTALLNELDGFSRNSGILVLAATNSIHALDPALIRPGRFDARFSVPYPDETSREELVELYSKEKPHDSNCTKETLAKLFNGFSCAKIESVLNRAALIANQNGKKEFSLEDIKAAVNEQRTAM